ncbi:MAG: hypothetical protein JOZ27_00645, partial [Caulobacteraceae bacterium]|nr:hypothetical protein [Caulobacteraceae bacterium]
MGGPGFLPSSGKHGRFALWLMSALDSSFVIGTGYLARQLVGETLEHGFGLLLSGTLAFNLVTSFGQLYRSWRLIRLRYEIVEIASSLVLTFLFIVLVALAEQSHASPRWLGVPRGMMISAWFLLAMIAIVGTRIGVRLLLRYHRAQGYDGRDVAFLGDTTTTASLIDVFNQHAWMGINVVGVFR